MNYGLANPSNVASAFLLFIFVVFLALVGYAAFTPISNALAPWTGAFGTEVYAAFIAALLAMVSIAAWGLKRAVSSDDDDRGLYY